MRCSTARRGTVFFLALLLIGCGKADSGRTPMRAEGPGLAQRSTDSSIAATTSAPAAVAPLSSGPTSPQARSIGPLARSSSADPLVTKAPPPSTSSAPPPIGNSIIPSAPSGMETNPRPRMMAAAPPAAPAPGRLSEDLPAYGRMVETPIAPVTAPPAPDSLRAGAGVPTGESRIASPALSSAPSPSPSAGSAGMGAPSPALTGVAPSETASSIAGGSSLAEPSSEYETVSVFYGTDRSVVEDTRVLGLLPGSWFQLTVVLALSTIGLAVASYHWSQSRSLLTGSAIGLAATAIFGGLTLQARNLNDGGQAQHQRVYGNQRGTLELGVCEVTIPKGHKVGEVERPSLLRIELSEDPLRHVVVVSVAPQGSDQFYAGMRSRVAGTSRKEAFVFVHGYNVTFLDAARRTAQISHDLQFEGAPIFFSWPSQGGLLGYTIDETNVVWTVTHLKDFLLSVAEQSGAELVHLVAHSMGNRALTSALREMYYELDEKCPKFHEVVLTAPDVDAEVFRRDLAPAILRIAKRVTLYASSNDEALVVSKQVHGYARAGDSGEGLVVVPGMDTIDVSAVDSSLLGHSYYGSNRTVLADLFDLIRQGKPANQRPWLQSASRDGLAYWVFAAAYSQRSAADPTVR